MVTHFGSSSDLPSWAVILAVVLAVVSAGLLLVELRQKQGRWLIALTGIGASAVLLLAALRPVQISAREIVVGPRVVVLADASRSLDLADGDTRRKAARDRAIKSLRESAAHARIALLGFGEGAPFVWNESAGERPMMRSDLAAALRHLAASTEERPSAVVIVSDGQVDDPPEGASDDALASLVRPLGIPVHAIATTRDIPNDASIRRVSAAGAAVAHAPLPLRVEIGCTGLSCEEVTVTANELREEGPPAQLASGLAHFKDGKAIVDLTVTFERAGSRILEIGIASLDGDTIPENNRRFLTFQVTRERVRVLHVAGRPTNDTRALRQWLKADASLDIVAFFILRTLTDDPSATQDELALIPFPVDELFTEHLPSFDAVVLQDFDAQPHNMDRHLPSLARYVRAGGGLVMVGGPNAFISGGYARTPLAEVFPVTMDTSSGGSAADTAPFVPKWTTAGRIAPMLAPLRSVVGEDLPTMPGANMLGDPRPGAIVLWTHATRTTRTGAPMPVLAIGDVGNGRSVALGIDGGWLLQYSQLGARTGGRGHAALWDGLLGWLMRDPRYEPAQLELAAPCTAGLASRLRAKLYTTLIAQEERATAELEVRAMDGKSGPAVFSGRADVSPDGTIEFTVPALKAGGYSAMLRAAGGMSTRRDFACEEGGDEWADSRPDPERLKGLARMAGGRFEWADAAGRLPLPDPTVVSSERHVKAVLPPWAWSLMAAAALGAHWFTRRRGGLS